MGYLILTGLAVVAAIAIVYSAIKLLVGKHWFLSWLRGTFGLCLLLLGGMLLFTALDIYSYRQLAVERNIATISFVSVGSQKYLATFAETDGEDQFFELNCDQWQLDTRIIKWNDWFNRMGLETGYRLDRINGRYLSLAE